jgi:hypothetical protein
MPHKAATPNERGTYAALASVFDMFWKNWVAGAGNHLSRLVDAAA